MIQVLIIFVLVHSISESHGIDLACRDDNGQPVDWWIVYNFPTKVLSKGKGESGTRYAFITSNDEDKSKFKLSPKEMKDTNNIFFNTVDKIYENPDGYEYLFYNDQYIEKKYNKSDETHLKTAHAKGVLGIGNGTGFWLLHSIPHFMPTPEEFSLGLRHPKSGRVKGQTAFCSTFKKTEIPKIKKQLLIEKVIVYASRIVDDQSLMKLFDENYKDELNVSKSLIETKDGVPLIHFAKTPSFSRENLIDLFPKMVEDLGVNLNVQTWKSGGGGIQPSVCDRKGNIKNIVTLMMQMQDGSETLEWKYTKDHSKWAVSEVESNPFTCIGDLNRMNSQHKRGGGMLCIKDPDVQRAFKNMIHDIEPC